MLSTITNLCSHPFPPFSARFQTLGSLCPSTTVSEQEDSATPSHVRVTPKAKGAEGPPRFGELPHQPPHTPRQKCANSVHMSPGKMGCGAENAQTPASLPGSWRLKAQAVLCPMRLCTVQSPSLCPALYMGIRAMEKKRGTTGTGEQSKGENESTQSCFYYNACGLWLFRVCHACIRPSMTEFLSRFPCNSW